MTTGEISTVSGGFGNEASGLESSVSGGQLNVASGSHSAISGGCNQIADEECQHLPACEDLCLPDANADAMIDVQDLIKVILNWGACGE